MTASTTGGVLLVDNHDSFTHNIADQIARHTGRPPSVVPNDIDLDTLDLGSITHIVLSPGPGSPHVPTDVGICSELLRTAEVPVLGICLGHQLLAAHFGGSVARATRPMHGEVSQLTHDGTGVFRGLPSPLEVVRYHSLAVTTVPPALQVTALSADGTIMGVQHRHLPLFGVQFHPESILSRGGDTIIANFLSTGATPRTARPTALPTRQPHRTSPSSHRSAGRLRVEVRRVEHPVHPEEVYTALYRGDPTSFWLDGNGTGTPSWQGCEQVSIMGACEGVLSHVLTHRADSDTTIRESPDGRRRECTGDVLTVAERELTALGAVDCPLPGFALGYVGYLGYGLKATTCGVPDPTPPRYPDARLTFAERAVVVDHDDGTILLMALRSSEADSPLDAASLDWLDRTEARIRRMPRRTITSAGRVQRDEPPLPDDTTLEGAFSFRHDRAAYLRLVETCQRLIARGESYEICLTNTVELLGEFDPDETYRRLRRLARVPHGAFLRCGDHSVLSASPERFLSVDPRGVVEPRPIKGTRPRGTTPSEDARLARALATSVKDRAENLMIVDLLRNDLNRVCATGTVEVPHLFSVDSFASVHQMSSTIRGRLRPGATAVDAIRATFPGGSMTGAPKLRTLQILDRLEAAPRGIYAGAIGWLGLNGAMVLSIAIRTIVLEAERATFGVGGAITRLSDPDEEYRETLTKARIMAAALLPPQ